MCSYFRFKERFLKWNSNLPNFATDLFCLRTPDSESSEPNKKMKNSHKCDKCNVKDEKGKLEVHMEKHRFKCDKCTEVFDTKLKVVEHMKVMHNFKCEKCKRSFEEKSTLDEHNKTNYVLKCKVCNIVFNFKNKLDGHIQKEHNFECTKCEDTFKSLRGLTRP